MDLVNGGDFGHFQQRWKKFIRKFEEAGIELIFVLDGPICPPDKRLTWIRRKTGKMNDFIFPIFDALNSYSKEEPQIDNPTTLHNFEMSDFFRFVL